jgi:hypothetical protein
MINDSKFCAGLRHPLHRQILEYWRSKAPPDRLPGRQHIDPCEIPKALPWVGLVDVGYRLIGTGVVAKMGRDATGKWFDEHYGPDEFARRRGTYEAFVRSRRPMIVRCTDLIPDGEFKRCDCLMLPLAADGETVDMILLLFAFER